MSDLCVSNAVEAVGVSPPPPIHSPVVSTGLKKPLHIPKPISQVTLAIVVQALEMLLDTAPQLKSKKPPSDASRLYSSK